MASLDPSIVKRQNTGVDSEHLQQLQRRLLEVVEGDAPAALYPAAACALADLREVWRRSIRPLRVLRIRDLNPTLGCAVPCGGLRI